MKEINYWIGVVSRAHVIIGIKGGFLQLNHGKKTPLQKLHVGDYIIMYSPRTAYPDGEMLQAFTAIGKIITGDIYQIEMSSDFKPYRVDIEYFKCNEAQIKPLIDSLSFIKNKEHWGAAFRFGSLKITANDFKIISKSMGFKIDFEKNSNHLFQ